MAIAKAGKLLFMDQGEYSDYTFMGFYVVLADFDPMKELDFYLEVNPQEKRDYRFNSDRFIGFLISKGLILEIDSMNLYLGSYGSANIKFSGYDFERIK